MAQKCVIPFIPYLNFASLHDRQPLHRLSARIQITRKVGDKVAETLMQYYFHCIILMSTSLIWIAESFNLC